MEIPQTFAKQFVKNLPTKDILDVIREEPSLPDHIRNYSECKIDDNGHKVTRKQRLNRRRAIRKEIFLYLAEHPEMENKILNGPAAQKEYERYLKQMEEKQKREQEKTEVEQFVNYVNENTELLSQLVNEHFQANKESIRKVIHKAIADFFKDGTPDHLEYSMRKKVFYVDGKIDKNLTLLQFLEELTGSHIFGNPHTYSDELQYLCLDTELLYLLEAIKGQLEKVFKVELSDKQMDIIKENCNDFDDIYDNSVASDFFFSEEVLEFLGTSSMTLNELLKEYLDN